MSESRSSTPTTVPEPPGGALRDFTTDRRVLLLSAMAVPVGAIGAVVAKALLWLMAVITNAAYFHRFSAGPAVPQGSPLGWWMVIVPAAGGLVVGLMARYGSEKIRGHGIPEALEAILLGRSAMSPRVAILKPVSSAIAIGTGGPFGAEGPIIVTGGAFGSIFAQCFHLSAAERKTLLVAGAAAGMAAVFATPIAATLLAVELLLFEWKPRSFIPAAVAATVASVLRVPLLGAGPMFPVAAHAVIPPGLLAMGLVVGVGVGLGSVLLTLLVYGCEDLFHRLPIHWMWWPAIGGLVVGLVGRLDPRVLGVGYGTIHQLMLGDLVGAALVGLVLAKAVVWTVALSSGTSGGVLAPLLLIGGALGALLGAATGAPGLWAMVGMAAMMGGTMNAPFTGMVFVLELTHDMNSLPALFIGSVAAQCVTVLLLRRSILTEKLARRGQHVSREYTVDVFEIIRVGDVMDREPPIVPSSMTVGALAARIAAGDPALTRRQGVLVAGLDGSLAGILTRGDLLNSLQRDPGGQACVLEIASRNPAVAFADETLHDAVARMLGRNIGRLPVVDRASPRRIVGYLGRAEVISARTHVSDQEKTRERGFFSEKLLA